MFCMYDHDLHDWGRVMPGARFWGFSFFFVEKKCQWLDCELEKSIVLFVIEVHNNTMVKVVFIYGQISGW